MKIQNPFKTKKILLISPDRNIKIQIPFIGRIKVTIDKSSFIETGSLKGNKYHLIIVDEILK